MIRVGIFSHSARRCAPSVQNARHCTDWHEGSNHRRIKLDYVSRADRAGIATVGPQTPRRAVHNYALAPDAPCHSYVVPYQNRLASVAMQAKVRFAVDMASGCARISLRPASRRPGHDFGASAPPDRFACPTGSNRLKSSQAKPCTSEERLSGTTSFAKPRSIRGGWDTESDGARRHWSDADPAR